MRMKQIPIYLFAMLTIFSACKEKEEVIDKCANGFVDIGEDNVDCGGNCPPCAPYEPASVYLECNGSPIAMPSKTLTFANNTWTLNAHNDTLSVQINLGSNGTVGTYTMNPLGTLGSINNTFYLNASGGTYSINAHNVNTQKMSGFFQVDLSRTGYSDTLKIRNGQFEFLPY